MSCVGWGVGGRRGRIRGTEQDPPVTAGFAQRPSHLLRPPQVKFYREVELKHGRVAMLASLGFLVGEQFHPLFGGQINVRPAGRRERGSRRV